MNVYLNLYMISSAGMGGKIVIGMEPVGWQIGMITLFILLFITEIFLTLRVLNERVTSTLNSGKYSLFLVFLIILIFKILQARL
jgi:hypothetical protein